MQTENTNKQMRYKKSKQVLGEGSYKTVSKAVDEEEGKEVAYNEVRIKNYEDETQTSSSFSKEIALLKAIDHPNIIKILDYWFTEENFIFITELMTGGSLKDYIQKNGPLNTRLIRKWGRQILQGMQYLHSLDPPIIHRDIKNDNIFVNSASGEIKIGDLGLARERKHKRYTIVGTPHFMAREMFEGEGYTEKVDIYAFGMCLIEMATGKTPYMEFKETTDIYKSVLQGILPKALQSIEDQCLKSLIMGCLVPSSYRFTSLQCLDHHFFYPDVYCAGDCIPKDCVAVYPIQTQPVKDMELSLISLNDGVITFQILLVESMRFIKFDYDISKDSVEKVANELISEKIIEKDYIDGFSSLLSAGIETAKSKIELGHFKDGMIELDSNEASNIKEQSMIVNGRARLETEKRSDDQKEKDFMKREAEFGPRTLEEMQRIEEEMKIVEARQELERMKEEEKSLKLKAKLVQKDGPFEPAKPEKETARHLATSSISSLVYTDEFSKALKFRNETKNSSTLEDTKDKLSENIYSQFPSVRSKSGSDEEMVSECGSMASSGLAETLEKLSTTPADNKPCIEKAAKESHSALNFDEIIHLPPIVSPPFSSSRLTEEQAANDLGLNKRYEVCKMKYRNNYSITQYALDAASITGRTEDTAKSWIKGLKDEDIETVFDLKLIVYEDWEKLPLTVFSCRAMQNMLYGIDGIPLKEKQLPMNPKLKEYDNRMAIRDFLDDVCSLINRKELVPSWENKLMAQDIQTVGELKSLHQEDWNRLGLSVFAYRILKNIIFRKGKILIEEIR